MNFTYNDALEYIHSTLWYGSKPGLNRIEELCTKLGNPQNHLTFIHVAGTNGKGSVSSMLSSVLSENYKKVGLFTSPYIYRFNERISINNNPISDNDLAEVVYTVKCAADQMKEHPTEFELITAAGFLYFYKEKCDVVVLETGLGGRLDSTNIIKDNILSIITGIDYDHTAILGDSLEKIAFEKAGIIKANCPVLIGKCKSESSETFDGFNSTESVIYNIAEKQNSTLYKTDYSRISDVKLNLTGTEFTFKNYDIPFKISLSGSYQTENAAIVITACEILNIDKNSIFTGLSKAKWRGRFELLSENPIIIYDGGHNPQGVNAAVDTVKKLFNEKIVVINGVMADKNYPYMCNKIAEIACEVLCVTPNNPRALDAKSLSDVYNSIKIPASSYNNISDAILSAIKANKPILGLGSLYMYKEFFDAVNKNKK